MKERKSGFYWVKKDFEWEVALWQSEYGWWNLPGVEDVYKDKDMEAINETPITPPEN